MNRRKFLKGAAVACAAVALPSAVLGLALKKDREAGKIAALGFQYGGKVGSQLFPNANIDGFHLEEGERLLITGAANPQSNGVYVVTKSSLAEAAMRGDKDLVEGITKNLIEPNRLFESIPFREVGPNQSHLVYERMTRNKTVEATDENDMRFYDENGKEQPFPRAVTCVKPDGVVARLDDNFNQPLTIAHIEELMSGFERKEASNA